MGRTAPVSGYASGASRTKYTSFYARVQSGSREKSFRIIKRKDRPERRRLSLATGHPESLFLQVAVQPGESPAVGVREQGTKGSHAVRPAVCRLG